MKKIIDIDVLLDIVEEVDNGDPTDWGALPVDEQQITRMLASDIIDQFENNWIENFDLEQLHYIMLATIVKLTAENFALNAMLYTGEKNAKSSKGD